MWDDIYDSSEKILKRILLPAGEERPMDGSGCPERLDERLREQLRYNSFLAYRKLQRHKYLRLIRRYAAVAGIVLAVGLAWEWLHREAGREECPAGVICPGNKKAILALNDGSVWYIGDTVRTIPTVWADIRVDSSGLSFRSPGGTKRNEEEVYQLLTIPRGGEFGMVLPDGSRVWLNSESELRFPLQFTAKQRKVFLTGEAYFEVAKDAEHPFIVEVNDSKIEVLGTGFNVRYYENEGRVITTLAEGSLCFKSADARVLLKPGEQSILENGSLRKREVEVYPYVAWKEGRFVFRKQRLEDIMATVSRWYDIEVRFEDEASGEITFSGGIRRCEGFEVFVKMIEETGSVKCDIKERMVCIAKKINKEVGKADHVSL